ncbi:DUF2520 domain-containing protein [Longimicrobium sp.]|uniref:Rossmann-like and DUF2520 domain-containing protein n=1 Tax=Longimicrobium sp. TaxID=2029185 RepID=UPI002C45A626|nr:DUF2520 domain-containing protein [Longimicrobium sp.]HSU15240.1 DUF2520 domain-containing protein [Longimicrobium sp.]
MTVSPGTLDRLWIVGAGRLGLALGLRLHRARAVSSLVYSGRRSSATPDHPLFRGFHPGARYQAGFTPAPEGVTGMLIAVPDDAIARVVGQLEAVDLPAGLPVMHASGSLSVDVLAPLAAKGHPVAGMHVLAAIADPVEGADRLRGATFGVEGEGAARALAERLVAACGGRVLAIRPGGKALYHAAAVFASNYAVALLSVAERLMIDAGVPAEDAQPALAALAAGAVENVAARGPAEALTGPIARGDAATVERHLSRLSGADRDLYCLLGLEALKLAEARGTDPAALARVRELLGDKR